MKRIVALILVVLTAFSCFACAGKENGGENKGENEIAYKIYMRGYREGMAPAKANGKEIPYYNSTNLQLENYAYIDGEEINEKAPAIKTIEINGKELTFLYEHSLRSELTESKNEDLWQIGYADVYSLSEKSAVKAEFDQKTGKLLYYIDPDDEKLGELTLEDAEREAVAFIQSQYGADALVGYEKTLAVAEEKLGILTFNIIYTKYLYGYATSEFISVRYDTTGKLVTFHARTHGVADAVKDDLSEEKIQNAEETLRSTFAKDADVQDERRILIDAASGVCYLEMTANKKVYYINII